MSTALQQSLSAEHKALFDNSAQTIARSINCLADDDRSTRKSALVTLTQFVRDMAKDQSMPVPVQLALLQHLLKPTLKLYADPTEKCRQLAVDLVQLLIKTYKPAGEIFLPYLVPVLVLRLGQKDIAEPSEEVRATLLQQVEDIIELAKADLGVYIDEMVQILSRTLMDEFPDVKHHSCRCTAILARDVPERFHMACKPLVQPLLHTLTHQHAKVRSVAVKAIGYTVQNGPGDILDEFRTALSQKTMDHSPLVRKSLYTIAGRWMLDLRDRYSYWHKILPILLSGETDEVEEVRDLARESFWKAGRQFEQENEEKLKDQLGFGAATTARPASGPVGCRELVRENFSKIMPGLLKDITDWSPDTRRQAARLLQTLLRYASSHVTMHIQKLMEGLRLAVLDEEADIGKILTSCAEIIGEAVDPEAWCAAILPSLVDAGAAARSRTACLVLVGACVRGSLPEQLAAQAGKIAEALADVNVCASEEASVADELVLTVSDFIDKCRKSGSMAPLQAPLFMALFTVLAIHERLANDAHAVLDRLATACGLEDRHALYTKEAPAVLATFRDSYTSWTPHSLGFRRFRALATYAGKSLAQALSQVMEIFVANVHPDNDVELRMRFFTLLGKLLSHAPESLNADGALPAYTKDIISKIVCPNLVWQAGDKSRALRVGVISCLWAVFHGKLLHDDDAKEVVKMLFPNPIFTSLDDESPHTRLVSCKVVEELLRVYRFLFTADFASYDTLHALLPELLKRLDDNDNDVRLAAAAALKAAVGCMLSNYDVQLYKAHTQNLFRALLVHLDDPMQHIQEAIFDVLNSAVAVNPEELQAAVEAVRHKHRSPDYCNRLLAALEQLPKN